ncbi:MAG TPA: polysaccharide biosynthesis protein, partial [Gammaproteobacteria bacterium]|nr:polysaccharide biosynthesis protein [Gammaproteobacteria bacterium]
MKKIVVNTGSNVSVVIVKLVITFIMTPVLVHNLGNYDYGIWEIIAAVIGYMGLLDMGLKPAISRFSASYHASGDSVRLQELYSTSFVFLAIIGLMLCLFFSLLGVFWPEVISGEDSDTYRYSLLLFIIAIQLLIEFPGYVAESFLEGFQKYYIKNNITIFNSIVGSSLLYFTISPENALVLLAGINAIGLSVKYIIYMFMLSRPGFGRLKPSISTATWRSYRETVNFGAKSFIQGVASRIEIGTDTIVIGAFLGPASIPFYAIPANIISYIRNIGWTLTHAFMPLFSELHATDKKQEIQQLYLNASRYIVAVLLPTSVGATLVGDDFIGVWVGEQYQRDAEGIILLLVIYMTLPFLNPLSTRYLTAIGRHGLLAKVFPVSASVNLIVSIILVQYWGIIGVAVGSVIPVFILTPVVLRACCKYLGISVTHYFLISIWPSVIPTVLMWLSVYVFCQFQPLASYIDILFAVITGAMVYCIVY